MKKIISFIIVIALTFSLCSIPAFAEDSSDTETELTPLDEVVVDDVVLPDLSELATRRCAMVVVKNRTSELVYCYVCYECVRLQRQSNNPSNTYYNTLLPYTSSNTFNIRFFIYLINEYNQFQYSGNSASIAYNPYDILYSNVNIYNSYPSDLLFEKNLKSFSFEVSEVSTDNEHTVTNIDIDNSQTGIMIRKFIDIFTGWLRFFIIFVIIYVVYKWLSYFI